QGQPHPLVTFVPVRLAADLDAASILPVRYHGSADLAALAAADGYLVVAENQTVISRGAWAPVLLK
ncbi:MAG: hypothetical protein ACRD13_14255, partial [Terriglobales bacterium]